MGRPRPGWGLLDRDGDSWGLCVSLQQISQGTVFSFQKVFQERCWGFYIHIFKTLLRTCWCINRPRGASVLYCGVSHLRTHWIHITWSSLLGPLWCSSVVQNRVDCLSQRKHKYSLVPILKYWNHLAALGGCITPAFRWITSCCSVPFSNTASYLHRLLGKPYCMHLQILFLHI